MRAWQLAVAVVVGYLGGLAVSGSIVFTWGFLQRFITVPNPDLFQAMTPGQRQRMVVLLALPIGGAYYWFERRRQKR